MRTSILLKAGLAVAAMAFAVQAQAQSQVGPQNLSMIGPNPLIGDGPRPFMTPRATARTTVQPLGDPKAWVGPADYPQAATAEKASGLVRFVLEVDEAGLVSGCKVLKSSGSKALDKGTCALMRQRARFLPGRDTDNEPIGGGWVGAVTWDYPGKDAAI